MRRGAITCSEETNLRDIAQIMVVNRVRYCAVINQQHEIRGLISSDSIVRAFGEDICSVKAKDILTPDSMVTTTPGTSLTEAIAIMRDRKIEHLIVVSDRPKSKAVLGILCAKEIVARMANRKERME
jgi:CBS domain-containing protein